MRAAPSSSLRLAGLAIFLLSFPLAVPSLAQGSGWPRRAPMPSAAGMAILEREVANGVRGAEWLARLEPALANDLPSDAAAAGAPADHTRFEGGPAPLGLSTDRIVNNRVPDAGSCSGCAFRPLSQAETTVALSGANLLVGWNNSRGFCAGGAVQGYGWSTDGGASWTDAGDPPALAGGGRYRGDPVHAVNRATGRFYLAGLYEGGANGSGLAVLYGSFSGPSFVIGDNRQLAVGGVDFIDKEWMDVDSLSGNVYLSWTHFLSSGDDEIRFARFDANLNSLGPVQTLSLPAAAGNVQGSRVVVGPNGVVWVVWYEYGQPLSAMKIRRSSDFGASFAPEATVATFYENGYNGAPGYRRGFAPTLPSIAVDTSPGPHRGRVYVAWDESVNFYDAVFPTASSEVSVENDGFFASATPFTPGQRLRGVASGTAEVDFFRFDATAGQTFVMRPESLATNVSLTARVVCSSDTAGSAVYRYLAFNTNATLCWTAPATGTYYLRLSPNTATAGNYVLGTTLDTPSAGERARANRDHFVSHSDDGSAWSTPVRVNDNPPRSDGIFPEVAVDGLGRVHCFWHDFRNDPLCGAESNEYGSSSGDGGVTWSANVPVSDAISFWSFEACGSANQGDYQGITAQGARIAAAWADSRLGDPDVWTDVSDRAVGLGCPSPVSLPAGQSTTASFMLGNNGSVDETLAWEVSDTQGWITSVTPGVSGQQTIAPGGGLPLQVDLTAPADCAGTPDTVFVVMENVGIPGEARACTLAVTCTGSVGVPIAIAHGLRLEAPRPNPSSGAVDLAYSLERPGRARLAIYSVAGARVRTLVDGERPAGRDRATWDGRDERGRGVAAGTYFVRLEAGGDLRVRRVHRVP